jgi:hypothetical protein
LQVERIRGLQQTNTLLSAFATLASSNLVGIVLKPIPPPFTCKNKYDKRQVNKILPINLGYIISNHTDHMKFGRHSSEIYSSNNFSNDFVRGKRSQTVIK